MGGLCEMESWLKGLYQTVDGLGIARVGGYRLESVYSSTGSNFFSRRRSPMTIKLTGQNIEGGVAERSFLIRGLMIGGRNVG